MNCLYCEERLSDYLEGALDEPEQTALGFHLASCPACTELLSNMKRVISWGHAFPAFDAPPWLPARIIANTPRIERENWIDTLAAVWRFVVDPRAAMGAFTAVLVVAWMGSVLGISPGWTAVVRNPAAIYYEAQGAVNRAYDEAVRRYYRSPVVIEIQTRIEQLREIS